MRTKIQYILPFFFSFEIDGTNEAFAFRYEASKTEETEATKEKIDLLKELLKPGTQFLLSLRKDEQYRNAEITAVVKSSVTSVDEDGTPTITVYFEPYTDVYADACFDPGDVSTDDEEPEGNVRRRFDDSWTVTKKAYEI